MRARSSNSMSAEAHINSKSDSVVEQAAQWHASLQSGDMTDVELQAFHEWHDADSVHATTYAKMSSLWSRFDSADSIAGKSTLHKLLKTRKSKLNIKKTNALVGLCLVSIVAWVGMQTTYPKYYLADYRSAVGQQRNIQLADNSEVLLDTNSAINIHYSQGVRKIELVQGSLFIKVSKDPTRPLIIATSSGTAQALGTQFFVEQHAGSMVVGVTESKVQVCAGNDKRVCTILYAGEKAEIKEHHLSRPQEMDVLAAVAWTKGDLIADNLALSDVLYELSRYKSGWISYDAEEMKKIRVSGVFKLSEVDQSLHQLAETLPIRLDAYTSYWTAVHSK